ncbi:hypothetical protein D9Q98_001465 [Chlorella vulgaris]|uniref:EF-hand domain-containing protein n=1 Tax=Chlorella vulgaris TaxID=3077 RepID=A0A9D4U051_CHLVU|nr:hypothetical protein D9Q98_001465 [Chlorella vulgaris]
MQLSRHTGGCSLAMRQQAVSPARPPRRVVLVRALKEEDEQERKKVLELEENLKKSGLDKGRAQQVLKLWQTAGSDGKEITPEELRKVLVKQGSKFSGLVLIQVILDIGAAYGAGQVGMFLGNQSEQFGLPAVLLQAVAYFFSGWYAIGAVFDLFKLGMLVTAISQFNVNSAAFLAAVKDLAGDTPQGLSTVDKAVEAVNTVKVVAGLNKMAKLLKEQQQGKEQDKSSGDMLRDLAAYLTLEKAQRLYDFDASKYGISEAQAAEIATVFAAFDSDENGVLSLDEFQRLCARYASELSAAEVKAALALLDDNKDGKIQLGEFVGWWVKEVQPAKA